MRKNSTGARRDTGAGAAGTRRTARAARRLALLAGATLVAGGVMAGAAHALEESPCGSNGAFSMDGASRSCTYTTAGEDTFTAPTGVAALQVVAIGGRGGSTEVAGGAGARVEGSLTEVAGTLYVVVGANGRDYFSSPCAGMVIGGGGQGTCDPFVDQLNGGTGGGASDVRLVPVATSTLTADGSDPRLLVAAGGGGSGTGDIFAVAGGDAGSTSVTGPGRGGDAWCEPFLKIDPGGVGGVGSGTGTGPGGQLSCTPGGAAGSAGVPGIGGAAGLPSADSLSAAGGGGGGWVGGGGGARTYENGAGGGGGASYGPDGATYQTARSQQPSLTISWTDPSDTTAPTVTITTPPDGATFALGASVLADYACADETGGSGLASCVGTVDDGAAIDTSTVGPKTLMVTATDNAGNTHTAAHDYTVAYAFGGFLAPIDDDGVYNRVKAGRSVPVKFSLGGNQGLDILAPGSPTSQPIACDGGATYDAVEETVTAGASGLSYANGQYTYTWKTNKSWTGCRILTVALIDGSTHTALFDFTR